MQAPQHMQALARANRVRLARAELKRSIARGDIDASEVVRECPWETESMTIAELLTSQRRWGRTRARKFLLALALNENKRLGTLTSRQRAAALDRAGRAAAAERRGRWSTPDAPLSRARPPTLKLRPPEARWKARRSARKAATKATAPTPRQTARIRPAR